MFISVLLALQILWEIAVKVHVNTIVMYSMYCVHRYNMMYTIVNFIFSTS